MKKTVRDIDVEGKRVFVRCDFNVPTDGEGRISDDRRIRGALPTIGYLIDHGAKVILYQRGGSDGAGNEGRRRIPDAGRCYAHRECEIPERRDKK